MKHPNQTTFFEFQFVIFFRAINDANEKKKRIPFWDDTPVHVSRVH